MDKKEKLASVLKDKEMWKEMFQLTYAIAIVAAAVYFFLIPSHCAVSSITGLAIVLNNFTPLSVAMLTFILNAILLVIGFFTCGKEFGVKTVYTSTILPIFIALYGMLFPNFTSFTHSQELDVICHCVVVSIGLSILFNANASSGGLDIVAKIMNKYFRIDIGKAMSIAGMMVAFSSAFAYDTKTVILSLLGTWINGIILDQFIFGQNLKRSVRIITQNQEDLRKFVLEDLNSGATIYKAYGAYNLDERDEMIVVVTKSEYQRLMTYLETKDPTAFVTVYTVADIRYRPKPVPEVEEVEKKLS